MLSSSSPFLLFRYEEATDANTAFYRVLRRAFSLMSPFLRNVLLATAEIPELGELLGRFEDRVSSLLSAFQRQHRERKAPHSGSDLMIQAIVAGEKCLESLGLDELLYVFDGGIGEQVMREFRQSKKEPSAQLQAVHSILFPSLEIEKTRVMIHSYLTMGKEASGECCRHAGVTSLLPALRNFAIGHTPEESSACLQVYNRFVGLVVCRLEEATQRLSKRLFVGVQWEDCLKILKSTLQHTVACAPSLQLGAIRHSLEASADGEPCKVGVEENDAAGEEAEAEGEEVGEEEERKREAEEPQEREVEKLQLEMKGLRKALVAAEKHLEIMYLVADGVLPARILRIESIPKGTDEGDLRGWAEGIMKPHCALPIKWSFGRKSRSARVEFADFPEAAIADKLLFAAGATVYPNLPKSCCHGVVIAGLPPHLLSSPGKLQRLFRSFGPIVAVRSRGDERLVFFAEKRHRESCVAFGELMSVKVSRHKIKKIRKQRLGHLHEMVLDTQLPASETLDVIAGDFAKKLRPETPMLQSVVDVLREGTKAYFQEEVTRTLVRETLQFRSLKDFEPFCLQLLGGRSLVTAECSIAQVEWWDSPLLLLLRNGVTFSKTRKRQFGTLVELQSADMDDISPEEEDSPQVIEIAVRRKKGDAPVSILDCSDDEGIDGKDELVGPVFRMLEKRVRLRSERVSEGSFEIRETRITHIPSGRTRPRPYVTVTYEFEAEKPHPKPIVCALLNAIEARSALFEAVRWTLSLSSDEPESDEAREVGKPDDGEDLKKADLATSFFELLLSPLADPCVSYIGSPIALLNNLCDFCMWYDKSLWTFEPEEEEGEQPRLMSPQQQQQQQQGEVEVEDEDDVLRRWLRLLKARRRNLSWMAAAKLKGLHAVSDGLSE